MTLKTYIIDERYIKMYYSWGFTTLNYEIYDALFSCGGGDYFMSESFECLIKNYGAHK
jgi:hypothetical protein